MWHQGSFVHIKLVSYYFVYRVFQKYFYKFCGRLFNPKHWPSPYKHISAYEWSVRSSKGIQRLKNRNLLEIKVGFLHELYVRPTSDLWICIWRGDLKQLVHATEIIVCRTFRTFIKSFRVDYVSYTCS